MTKLKTWFAKLTRAKKIILASLVILLLTGAGAGAWYYNRISDLEKLFPDLAKGEVNFPEYAEAAGPKAPDVREAFSAKILNVLLMGFDRDESRIDRYTVYRPDTIMLASIRLDTGKVNVVSIPRDTLVPIYNMDGGKDKINSAYTYGWRYGGAPEEDEDDRHQLGMEYQLKTISMALKGVPIHYYMSIDMDGVVDVVETLGGVWYDVEKRTYDKQGRLIAEPGYQLLSGRTFLRFVRNRNYSSGDLKRVENQQKILLAAFQQYKTAGTLLQAPQIYSSLRSRIETNLSLEQIMALALFASKEVEKDTISTHILETSYSHGRLHESWESSYSYLIINQKKRAELIYEIWGLDVDPDPTDTILPPLPSEEPDSSNASDSPLLPIGDGGSAPPVEGGQEEPAHGDTEEGDPGLPEIGAPGETTPVEPVEEVTS